MNISPSAKDLLKAFDEWMQDSSKTIYRFELEEQQALEHMIKVMNNQINMLVDYELKKNRDK